MCIEPKVLRILQAIADKTSWIYVAGPSKYFDEAQSLRTIQKLARGWMAKHAIGVRNVRTLPTLAELEAQAKQWFEEEHDFDCPWKDMASFARHVLKNGASR